MDGELVPVVVVVNAVVVDVVVAGLVVVAEAVVVVAAAAGGAAVKQKPTSTSRTISSRVQIQNVTFNSFLFIVKQTAWSGGRVGLALHRAPSGLLARLPKFGDCYSYRVLHVKGLKKCLARWYIPRPLRIGVSFPRVTMDLNRGSYFGGLGPAIKSDGACLTTLEDVTLLFLLPWQIWSL